MPPTNDRRLKDEPGAERGEGQFPRGLKLRLFAYLVGGHLLAGFLYLLFYLGANR